MIGLLLAKPNRVGRMNDDDIVSRLLSKITPRIYNICNERCTQKCIYKVNLRSQKKKKKNNQILNIGRKYIMNIAKIYKI